MKGKVAVIYGAAGGVGTAVAKAFAREGATVFLAGRTEGSLKAVAQEITSSGGKADASKVDALSSESVETHLAKIVDQAGKLDISFNLIGTKVEIGSKLTELTDQRFADAAFKKVRSYFITMTAADNGETAQRCYPRAHSPQCETTKTEHGRIRGGRSGDRSPLQAARLRGRP